MAMYSFFLYRKDKIRLSMPFNQTKTQIINVIETLEKVINDLKE